jgi:hypothetical protein
MSEKKSRLVKNVLTAGLFLLPFVSNGQKLKEDINWTKVKEPYGKYTLTVRSTYPLNELSGYQTSHRQPFLPYGNLNIPYKYNYTVPQDSIKGNVSRYLKKIDVCPDCTKTKGTTSTKKKRTIPTKPIQPQKPVQKPILPPASKLEKKIETPNTLQKEAGVIYNVNETNTTNNITNYYITPEKIKATANTASEKTKENYLKFRTIIDAGKIVNPINSPFWNFSINPQLYNGSFGFGPYLTIGVGKEKEMVTTKIENETLLNQNLQLFTGTKSIRKETLERCLPTEWGVILSAGTKDNKVRADIGCGFLKEVNTTSGVSESGIDYIRQGDIVKEKPYSIELEEGKTFKTLKQTQHIGIAISPFKNGRVALKGKVKHIGKSGSGDGFFIYEAGLSGTFGGNKK